MSSYQITIARNLHIWSLDLMNSLTCKTIIHLSLLESGASWYRMFISAFKESTYIQISDVFMSIIYSLIRFSNIVNIAFTYTCEIHTCTGTSQIEHTHTDEGRYTSADGSAQQEPWLF